jgi:AraC-like DNA-binding protein
MRDLKEGVENYVEKNMNRKILLENIAKHVGYSKSHLCRKFKKNTGYTVKSYITKLRFEEARKELRNGISVSRATENCGYDTLNGFEKAYKKEYGHSPKKERNAPNEKK